MDEYVCYVSYNETKSGGFIAFEQMENIVRCRDCKYSTFEYGDRGPMFCKRHRYSPLSVMPDDFCSRGKTGSE